MGKVLAVPGSGFVANSVNVHRSDVVIVADWVEATALFYSKRVTRMEVRDFLCDNSYYQSQAFAMQFVGFVWAELRTRMKWVAKFPLAKIDKDSFEGVGDWKSLPGYAFCLMLSHLQRYSRKQFPDLHSASYVTQGDLFERFCEESLARIGWKTYRTGWASGISNPKFTDLITAVAAELNETWINAPAAKTFADAKDEGLDLVAQLPFPDARVGRPYYLVQCASGDNWEDKLHTPSTDVWSKLIVFTCEPRRGFCFPLALNEDDFRGACVRCSGMLLDRYRLMSNGTGLAANLSKTLAADIEKWLKPRIAKLPRA